MVACIRVVAVDRESHEQIQDILKGELICE